jgi:uncharacterized protein involved in exopolysaccharide biosynthesis
MTDGNGGEGAASLAVSRLVVRTGLLAVVAAVLAAALSLTLENQYRAHSVLLLAPLPINVPENVERGGATTGNAAAQVSFLMVKPLSVPDYKLLLMNDEIVQALRDEMQRLLVQSGDNQEADIRLEDVRRAMAVRTTVLKQTVYDIVHQPVIQLEFTATSPELAAALANKWAALGLKMAEDLSSKGREGLVDFLEAQYAEKEAELVAVEKEIEALDSEMPVETWLKHMQSLQEQATAFEIELAQLKTDIARAEGQVTRLQEQRESIDELVTVRKAVPDEAYWLLADQGQEPDDSKVLASQEVNWVYSQVRKEEVTAQSELEGMLKEKGAIETELEGLQKQILELQGALALQTRLRNEAQRRMGALSEQYQQLAVNYGAAQIAEAANTPDLKVAAEAAPPEKTIGPHRSLIVIAAALLGLLIAPCHFFFMAALRYYTRVLGNRLTAG